MIRFDLELIDNSLKDHSLHRHPCPASPIISFSERQGSSQNGVHHTSTRHSPLPSLVLIFPSFRPVTVLQYFLLVTVEKENRKKKHARVVLISPLSHSLPLSENPAAHRLRHRYRAAETSPLQSSLNFSLDVYFIVRIMDMIIC